MNSKEQNINKVVQEVRSNLSEDIYEGITKVLFDNAKEITHKAVSNSQKKVVWQDKLDKLLTSKTFGFPIMLLVLTVVFWLTISGAQVPSGLLFDLLVGWLYPILSTGAENIGMAWWLKGTLIDGAFLSTAWVVAVMLPPMAIFFPLFTLLEDFGYLPRVAFNLDHLFSKVGAHGKQSLTMAMGFGCNAAAIVSTRIIESPRERLIAIITNNFSLCNGRWPLQILLATIFIGAMVPAGLAGLISAFSVVAVTILGVILAFASSYLFSKTMLKGESSFFILELPAYRRPNILKTLYTSFIDRTLIVLSRAVVFAIPAGIIIWLISNLEIYSTPLSFHISDFLNPMGILMGLNGIILLSYLIAIPANEIVIPTIIMLTLMQLGDSSISAGVLIEPDGYETFTEIFASAGWTLLTAINLMIFSLIHNPCSTTIYTIWKETRSPKWTTVATLYPVFLGILVTIIIATVWRLFI